MEGVHIYFEIALNEEEILADGYEPADIKLMYDFMDDAFTGYKRMSFSCFTKRILMIIRMVCGCFP